MSKHFSFACYKELVEKKTADGQMGPAGDSAVCILVIVVLLVLSL